MKEKTIFEKIIDRELPATVLHEDEKSIVFLDAFPFEEGHILVVPKKAYEFIWEMEEEDFLHVQKIVFEFVKKTRQKYGDVGINVLQNNKAQAGQTVNHVHFHIIPRHLKTETKEESKKSIDNVVDKYFYEKEKDKKESSINDQEIQDNEEFLETFIKDLKKRGKEGFLQKLYKELLNFGYKKDKKEKTLLTLAKKDDYQKYEKEIKEFDKIFDLNNLEIKEDSNITGGFILQNNKNLVDNSYKTKLIDIYKKIVR